MSSEQYRREEMQEDSAYMSQSKTETSAEESKARTILSTVEGNRHGRLAIVNQHDTPPQPVWSVRAMSLHLQYEILWTR